MTDATPINEKAEAKALTPDIAWPSLAFMLGLILVHWSLVAAGLNGLVPLWVLIPILGYTTYAHYTLVHEAVHRNFFKDRKYERVQQAIGWYGSLMLFSDWPLLERTHKNHHSHVNTEKDPDLYVKKTFPQLMIYNLIRGLLQVFPIQLLRLVFRDRTLSRGYINAPSLMTGSEKIQHYAANWILTLAFWTAVFTGFGWQALALYYLPVFIALNLLVILFQWLPHHPFSETGRYRATRNTGRSWLNLPFLWQNWHLMHHLWPSVPVYNYERLYRRLQPVLAEKGARMEEGVTPKGGPIEPPPQETVPAE
jgi:fatty acid desaturase